MDCHFLIILDIFIFKKIGALIFEGEEDFWQSIEYAFTPDFLSFLIGIEEYKKDKISGFKLSIFILACIVVIAVEYWITSSIFS